MLGYTYMSILMLMVFNGALGSGPDINITGEIERLEYKIECDSSYRPLEIEFLKDDRTECAITTLKGRCSYFDFEHTEPGKVVFVSDRKPSKDQLFGCEMIFKNAYNWIKVQCSVKFNGTAFVQLPKQFSNYTYLSNTRDVNNSTTAQDYGFVNIFYVVLCPMLIAQTVVVCIVVYRRRSNSSNEATQAPGTQSNHRLLEGGGTELMPQGHN